MAKAYNTRLHISVTQQLIIQALLWLEAGAITRIRARRFAVARETGAELEDDLRVFGICLDGFACIIPSFCEDSMVR